MKGSELVGSLKKISKRDGFKATLALCLCWLFFFLLSLLEVRCTGAQDDDAVYTKQLLHMNGIQWLGERYRTWSGRAFSEVAGALFFPAPQMVWRIVNAAFAVLLVYAITKIAFRRINIANVAFVCAAYWLIAPKILLDSTFWMTGSFVYLWPAALAVFSCIVLDNAVRGEKTKYWFLYVVAALFASTGGEQVGPCIVGFSAVAVIYLLATTHKLRKEPFAVLIVSVIGVLFELTSPGEQARSGLETKHWYPEYKTLPLWEKITRGMTWQFSSVANDMFLLLTCIIVALVLAVVMRQKAGHQDGQLVKEAAKTTSLDYALMAILIGQLLVVAAEPKMRLGSVLFNFIGFGSAGSALAKIVPYLFWTVLFVCLIVLLLRFVDQKYTVLFIVLASVCAEMIMYFSPTIYASGARPLYLSSIMMVVVLCMIQRQSRNRIAYAAIYVPAIAMMLVFVYRIMRFGYSMTIF
ncbi:DUF6056 family protein [Bifidobacterium sp. ESL0763]|uniref:DUF6056 family protein n=1 Tax=Bifidobacterium sp. ESL0763 TaxID=2983227 RepID=UPI0023FA13DE|nr:DUF6056 family protein [Bifidobacterium sp. ESL0763]MDF7663240.1 DUF6056 family protein [Bifidobacterium sp. ESL0763]